MFFFIISKLLNFILNPIIWILTLLLFALFVKNSVKKKRLIIITICVTYFFSNPFIIMEFYRVWEIQPLEQKYMLPQYDVGVVLGGGMMTYDSRLERYTFRANTDRIMQAFSLYKQQRIKKILISGGSGSLVFRNLSEASFIKNYFVENLNIPEGDILIDTISDNTYQNAVESAALIKANFDNPKVLLITSAFHMRRSYMCFKKQGITADLYTTDLAAGIRRYQFDMLFMPSLHSLMHWNKLIHEWLGIITYKIVGYI